MQGKVKSHHVSRLNHNACMDFHVPKLVSPGGQMKLISQNRVAR